MHSLRRVISRHESYLAAVATSYGQMGVSLVVQLLMVPLYLDHLGDYRFGVLMMLLSAVNFGAVGVVWLSGSMQRALAEAFARADETGFSDAYTVSKWLLLAYGAAVAVLATGAAVLFPTQLFDAPPSLQGSVIGGVIGAAIYFGLQFVLSIDRVALTARGRQDRANITTIASQATFAVLAVPVLMLGGDLLHVTLCMSTGVIVGMGLARVYLGRMGLTLSARVRPGAVHRALVGRLAGRTGGAYLIYGTLALLLQADVLIVGWLAGPEIVARFVLVWRIAELAILALWRLPDSQIPYIIHRDARGQHTDLQRSLWRSIGLMWLASGVAGVFYALAGPWLVSLWVGADKAPEAPLAYILAGGAIMWVGAARAPIAFSYALVRLRGINVTMTAELAAKVSLTLLLLPRFGILAPLIAINACFVAGLAVVYPLLGRRAVQAEARPTKS